MPALGTVTFASTHSDSRPVTSNGSGVFYLTVPNAPGTLAAAARTNVDLHLTVSIPVGYVGLISNFTNISIVGAAHCAALPQIIVGTGAPVALTVDLLNVSDAAATPTLANTIAVLSIIKNKDFSHEVLLGY